MLRLGGHTVQRLFHPVPALLIVLLAGAGVLQAQNTLAANPGTVFLNGSSNGAPVQQTFALTSSPAATVAFTSTFSNAGWLAVSPSSGATPSTINLTANPSGLAPGVYSTTLTISSSSAGSVSVLVVFTVNNVATPLTANPGNVVFTYQPNTTLPAAVTLNITTGLASPPFTLTPL